MYLTKLLIRDFGKFHNKNMDLQPGVNIIYGEDGAGKSTVRDFLVGLIYGIPRRDGITKVGSNYELRKPESGSGYSGTAYLKDDEKTYLVDRTFLAGAKKASVLDVQSGREVNLKYQDTLSGTLIETDKNTFLDTRCIIEKASNSVDNLQDYLTNITLTGTANINKSKAIEYLEKEKKSHVPRPLIRRLDELDKKIAEYDGIDDEIEAVENEIKAVNEEFVIEAERRKRAARQMVENEDGTVTFENDQELEEKIDLITEKVQGVGASDKKAEALERAEKERKKEEKKDIPFTDRIPVIIATGLFVIFVIGLIVNIMGFEPVIKNLFIIFTALFVVITTLDGFREKGFFESQSISSDTPDEEEFKRVLEELKEEAKEQEEIEIDMDFAKEYQDKKAELKEKEDALLTRRNERNKLRHEFDTVFKKKSELEEEINAIDYAIKKINSLSENYRKDAFKNLLGNVSRYISSISDNRFSSLMFDDLGRIILKTEYGLVPIDNLTDVDAGKVYLAIRLSIAKYMAKEKLPLIIDGTSVLESASEVKALADCLSDMNEEQVIILTEDWGMDSMFKSKGIEANLIKL